MDLVNVKLLLSLILHRLVYAVVEPGNVPLASPIFLSEPPNNVLLRTTVGAELQCVASGNPQPTVQWVGINLQPVSNVTGYLQVTDRVLKILPFMGPIQSNIHRTKYRCIAKNQLGSLLSKEVSIRTVRESDYESYSTTLQRQVWSTEGSLAVFMCEIQPQFVKPYVTITGWTIDGQIVTSNTDGVFCDGNRLIIYNVSSGSDSIRVNCQTVNHFYADQSQTSEAATLRVSTHHVYHKPELLYSLNQVEADIGASVYIPCVAQAWPQPSYNWTKGGTTIQPDLSNPSPVGFLHITGLELTDAGLYRCNVSNSMGSVIEETTLSVYADISASILPRAQVVHAGDSATLRCDVYGGPISSILWYHNGEIIPSMERQIRLISDKEIEIKQMNRNHAGVYQCMVSNNRQNNVTSAHITLGDAPPTIHNISETQYKRPSDNLELVCQASGNPLPKVTWYLAGKPLEDNSRLQMEVEHKDNGDVINKLTITSLVTLDGGNYVCQAENTLNTAYLSSSVKVYGAPIVRNIDNQTAAFGSSLFIPCYTAGHPISSIDWKKGSQPVIQTAVLQTNRSGLLIQNIALSDTGSYTCTASNDGLSSSNSFYLRVVTLPVIQDMTIPALKERDEQMIMCQARGGDLPLTAVWLKNGQPIRDNGILIKTQSDRVVTLTFLSVKQSDIGNYTCRISNMAGIIEKTVELASVNVPAQWTMTARNTSTLLNSGVQLTCQASGIPTPNITWTFSPSESVPFKAACSFTSSCRDYNISSNGTLTIPVVHKDLEGYYMCKASNGIGSDISHRAYLNVNTPPYFETPTEGLLAQAGYRVEVYCRAAGDLPITFQWYRKMRGANQWEAIIPGKTDERFSFAQQPNGNLMVDTFSIQSALRSDSADYRCKADNLYGFASKLVTLTIREPPGKVGKVHLLLVEGRTAQITWQKGDDGNSRIRQYEVNLTTSGRPDIVESCDNNEIIFQALRPATSYNVTIRARNDVGVGPFSSAYTFLTQEEIPEVSPAPVTVQSHSANSLSVSWKKPSHGLNGKLLGYVVSYTPENGLAKRVILDQSIYPQEESYTLVRLQPDTFYSIGVAAYNSKGEGLLSRLFDVATMSKVPRSGPRSVKVTNIGQLSVNISYSRVDMSNVDAQLTGYLVVVSPVLHEGEQIRLMSTNRWVAISDLNPYTNYSIVVQAKTHYGNGGSSSPVFIVTDPIVASSPRISAAAINSSSVVVSWLSDSPPTGLIEDVEIVQTPGIRSIIISPPTQNYYIATGLNRNTEYKLKLRMKHSQRPFGPFSEELLVKTTSRTPPHIPLQPTQVKVAVHERAALKCDVFGHPLPHVTCGRIDGSLLIKGDLVIERTNPNDAGVYKCSATNSQGEDSIVFNLTVTGLPREAPAQPQIEMVSNSVQLSLQAPPDVPVSYWLVNYKPITSQTWLTYQPLKHKTGNSFYWLHDLDYGTNYQIKVRYNNTEGRSPASAAVTAVTPSFEYRMEAKLSELVFSTNESRICLNLSQWIRDDQPIDYIRLHWQDKTTHDSNNAEYNNAVNIVCTDDIIPTSQTFLKVSVIFNSQQLAVLEGTLGEKGMTYPGTQNSDSLIEQSPLSLLVGLSLSLLLLLAVGFGLICFLKRRKLKNGKKKTDTNFRGLPRDAISGDSNIWLLHQQNHDSKQHVDCAGDECEYEICSPTMTFSNSKMQLSRSTTVCCQADLSHANDKLLSLQGPDTSSSEFPPPHPEVVTLSTSSDVTQKGVCAPIRLNVADLKKYPSCMGSSATVSSNHEELMNAYHNFKLMAQPWVPPLNSTSNDSDVPTEPGIKYFTASPPQPQETRQAICEVLGYKLPGYPGRAATLTARQLPPRESGSYDTSDADCHAATMNASRRERVRRQKKRRQTPGIPKNYRAHGVPVLQRNNSHTSQPGDTPSSSEAEEDCYSPLEKLEQAGSSTYYSDNSHRRTRPNSSLHNIQESQAKCELSEQLLSSCKASDIPTIDEMPCCCPADEKIYSTLLPIQPPTTQAQLLRRNYIPLDTRDPADEEFAGQYTLV